MEATLCFDAKGSTAMGVARSPKIKISTVWNSKRGFRIRGPEFITLPSYTSYAGDNSKYFCRVMGMA